MRKFFLSILLVSLLFIPTSAQAQNNAKIGELTIQLWPEYDDPGMLVMYSFALSADTALPTDVQMRIPANANLNAVAKTDVDSMVNVPYDAPVKDGDWVIITMPIDDLSLYRIEYYAPIEKDGSTRNFDLLWSSDYAVESLFVQFQQPSTASDFTSTPMLPNINPVSGGLTYHDLDMGDLAAGSEFSISISYEKPNDDLTVSSMPVEVGGGSLPETNQEASSFSAQDTLPFVLVGIGILLIAGGLLYFFSAGRRTDLGQSKSRKRHSPRAASAGGNIYCHECGGRASGGDKFCRSCGAKLRM